MPTSFQNLIRSRVTGRVEENLETGKIYVFTPGTMYTNFCSGFCWNPPGTGQAVIEVWGAGGSGAQMCCCGGGTPGNAGAYAKRTIQVTASNFVRGTIGNSCGNSSALCFRGCSDPTEVCWTSSGVTANGCICAQGGAGGRGMCSTGTSMFCCFVNQSHCFTGPFNDNCGIICNYFPGIWIACAYGGDVNCCGQFSCTAFFGCQPACPCCTQFHVASPAGFYSCGAGNVAAFGAEDDNRYGQWSGQTQMAETNAFSALRRSPTAGIPMNYCWRSDRSCGCYEMHGCMHYATPGTGGHATTPCPAVRDHAGRGGWGAVRIRFFT